MRKVLYILLLSLIAGMAWGQMLLDNYDGSGDLTYQEEYDFQWSIAGGQFVCSTSDTSKPEHSYASYNLSLSIPNWTLNKSVRNCWFGWMNHNEDQVTGWTATYKSCGMVLAADNADFNATTTKGYAVGFRSGGTPDDALVIFRFDQGINVGTSSLPGNSSFEIVSSTYSYNSTDGGVNFFVELLNDGHWKIFYKKGAQLDPTQAIFKSNYSDDSTTSAIIDETYSGDSYKYTGWIRSHGSTTKTAYFDNFGAGISGDTIVIVSPSSFAFGTISVGDTSNWQTFSVSGLNLAEDIKIKSPSANYKISLDSTSGYVDSICLVPSEGKVPATDIYVIFAPQDTFNYNQNIAISTLGADTQYVALTGKGSTLPYISIKGSLYDFGALVVGQISDLQAYTVSGLHLKGNIVIKVPSWVTADTFKVSLDRYSGFADSVYLVPVDSVVAEDSVYVLFRPGSTGKKSGSITHTSLDAATKYRAVSGKGVVAEPTIQATNLQITNVGQDIMTLSWSAGGQSCIVLGRCEDPVDLLPVDGNYYTARDSFGEGSQLGYRNYVLYKGTGTSLNVHRLYGNSNYYYLVCTYAGTDSLENYRTFDAPTVSAMTIPASICTLKFADSTYSQDFNLLDGSFLPRGWNFSEEGPISDYSYVLDDGGGISGNCYSYGLDGSTDRAFGGLQTTTITTSLRPTVRGTFLNNSSDVIKSFYIDYYGEEWRLGEYNRNDTLKFYYATDPGPWTEVTQLRFVTPNISGSEHKLNGNLAENRRHIYYTIPDVSLAIGDTLYIRWADANATSSDDGLAIDDFKLIPMKAGYVMPMLVGTSPADSANRVELNAQIKIGFNDSMDTGSLYYHCSPDPGNWSASWNATKDTVTLSHNNFDYITNYTFTVDSVRNTYGYPLIPSNVPNPFHFTTKVNPIAPPMYITMINVGQGDGMAIKAPNGKRILIDAGPSDLSVWGFVDDSLGALDDRYLDYIFLTHYDQDHSEGMDYVILNLDSLNQSIYDRGDEAASGTDYTNYINAINSRGWSAKRHTASIGDEFDLGYGAYMQVICVNGQTSGDNVSSLDENNRSVGLLINYANEFKMVTCGDIDIAVENILYPDINGRISVLKANHHGSKFSNGLSWVQDLDPMVTLISVGEGNSFGHPDTLACEHFLSDPKPTKSAGDSNRIYRTEYGADDAAPTTPGRDTALYENIHIVVTPANSSYCFMVLNDSTTYPWINGPLAVYLSTLTALTTSDNKIQITWRTESEENTYLWEIERSPRKDGGFIKIGTVPGHGTTNQPNDYTFTDPEVLPAGTYWYRLCEIELDGDRHYYGPVSLEYYPVGRYEFALAPARPNPFNQQTTISYQIAKTGPAILKIYNILGQEVRTLAEGVAKPGRYQATWDGSDSKGRKVASGIYFYRLTSGQNQASERLIYLR